MKQDAALISKSEPQTGGNSEEKACCMTTASSAAGHRNSTVCWTGLGEEVREEGFPNSAEVSTGAE